MANLQERRNKDGKLISYSIRIFRGRGPDGKQLKPFTATFEVKPTWSEKSARKKAEAYAATLEKEVKEGRLENARQRFDQYCDYVLELKKRSGTKQTTLKGYRYLIPRTYKAIGHILLKDLRPDHLNAFYMQLEEEGSGVEQNMAVAKNLPAILNNKGMTRKELAERSGVPLNTVYLIVKGNPTPVKKALAICKGLNMELEEVFTTERKVNTLSANTIQHYHRMISMVLEHAVKEGLVVQNVAKRATLPKIQHKEVNHFQPEELIKIQDALEKEDIKWRTMITILMMSGCRRGELMGLKWDRVDFEQGTIRIDNNVLYVPGVGLYEDTPKTRSPNAPLRCRPRRWNCSDNIRSARRWRSNAWETTTGIKIFSLRRRTVLPCTRIRSTPGWTGSASGMVCLISIPMPSGIRWPACCSIKEWTASVSLPGWAMRR